MNGGAGDGSPRRACRGCSTRARSWPPRSRPSRRPRSSTTPPSTRLARDPAHGHDGALGERPQQRRPGRRLRGQPGRHRGRGRRLPPRAMAPDERGEPRDHLGDVCPPGDTPGARHDRAGRGDGVHHRGAIGSQPAGAAGRLLHGRHHDAPDLDAVDGPDRPQHDPRQRDGPEPDLHQQPQRHPGGTADSRPERLAQGCAGPLQRTGRRGGSDAGHPPAPPGHCGPSPSCADAAARIDAPQRDSTRPARRRSRTRSTRTSSTSPTSRRSRPTSARLPRTLPSRPRRTGSPPSRPSSRGQGQTAPMPAPATPCCGSVGSTRARQHPRPQRRRSPRTPRRPTVPTGAAPSRRQRRPAAPTPTVAAAQPRPAAADPGPRTRGTRCSADERPRGSSRPTCATSPRSSRSPRRSGRRPRRHRWRRRRRSWLRTAAYQI